MTHEYAQSGYFFVCEQCLTVLRGRAQGPVTLISATLFSITLFSVTLFSITLLSVTLLSVTLFSITGRFALTCG